MMPPPPAEPFRSLQVACTNTPEQLRHAVHAQHPSSMKSISILLWLAVIAVAAATAQDMPDTQGGVTNVPPGTVIPPSVALEPSLLPPRTTTRQPQITNKRSCILREFPHEIDVQKGNPANQRRRGG